MHTETWLIVGAFVLERIATTMQIYFMRREVQRKIEASMRPPPLGRVAEGPAVCTACNQVIRSYPHYCTPPRGGR